MFEMTIWNMLQIKTYDTRFDVRALAANFCFFSFKSIRYSRYSFIHFCTFSLARSDNRCDVLSLPLYWLLLFYIFFGDIIVIIIIIRWSFLLANEFSTCSYWTHQMPIAEFYTQRCSHIQFYRERERYRVRARKWYFIWRNTPFNKTVCTGNIWMCVVIRWIFNYAIDPVSNYHFKKRSKPMLNSAAIRINR